MPRTVNEAHVAGHVGRDAELKYTSNGNAVATFSVATGGGKKKDGGEWPTEWHNVVAWGGLAEQAKAIHKGVFVDVRGRIQTRSWDDRRSGEKKYKTEIVASEVTVGTPSDEQAHQRPLVPDPQPAKYDPRVTTEHPITDDDIPF